VGQRVQNIIFNSCILLNCLLLSITVLGDKIAVPTVLQVVGRMHPLLLHFPIVLVFLGIITESVIKRSDNQSLKETANWLLLSAAFTSAITALMGSFLSREGGYDQQAIAWHQWTGVAVSFICLCWYAWREKIRSLRFVNVLIASVAAVAVVITGHKGANITHGNNFILAPLSPAENKEVAVPLNDAEAYRHFIQPILQAKCMGCHNTKKAKGGLVMETEALLLKGGKNGKLWDSTSPDFGLMMQRIHMAEDGKEHMPPVGKPQLTEEEKKSIFYWLKSGASFTKKIVAYDEADSLRILAAGKFKRTGAAVYDFPVADAGTIKKLNTDYRVVQPVDAQSPALSVEFYGAGFYKGEQLKELEIVKNNIISLGLNKMPVKDEDLKWISGFTNLRKLNLSFTQITGAGLAQLQPLKELQQLSLSGNALKATDLSVFNGMNKLNTVYLWNTGIRESDLVAVKTAFPGVSFQTGFNGDTVITQLSAPIIEAEEAFFTTVVPVKIKGLIRNTVVRYTTDGSTPDSLTSPLYKGEILIDKTSILKVKAFLPGWVSSNIAEKSFYHAGIKIDSIELETKPNAQYAANGGTTLHDQIKGDLNFRTKWLGYREGDLKAYLYFSSPVKLSGITLSMLMDVNSYIMPAQQIEVWGGASKSNLRLLQKINPDQPKMIMPPTMAMNQVTFPLTELKVLKVVVKPVILPNWHPGKGERGWVFFDEFFVQ